MVTVKQCVVGQLQTNCFILYDTLSHDGVIIDPGDDASFIAETCVHYAVTPLAIVATHGHFDHIMAAWELQHMFTIPCYLRKEDGFLLSRMATTAQTYLKRPIVEPPPDVSEMPESSLWRIGSIRMKVIRTPGHTPGGIAVYVKASALCFTGDTLFEGGAMGEWRHEYANRDQLLESVHKLLLLPGETILYPGHGLETTVTKERTVFS